MTDNISRMYELANIEATAIGCTNEDIQSPDYYSNDCEGDCIDCTWYDEDEVYPPFTDTKQLELIKFFGRSGNICIVLRDFKGTWLITNYMRNGMGENIDFSQALATFVINVWDLLNDAGKQEIKRILE